MRRSARRRALQPLKVLEPVDETRVERVADVVFRVRGGGGIWPTVGFAPVAALGLCLFSGRVACWRVGR